MAEAKTIPIPNGPGDAARTQGRQPILESRAHGSDRHPIWVGSRDAENVRGMFRLVREELERAGFRCDYDLQTEPHDGLKIEAYFEIFLHIGQKRVPENFGMVTLYSDPAGNLAIKMSPGFPEACSDFRSALAAALERRLGEIGGSGAPDVDLVVRQQDRYEPPRGA